MGSYTSPARVPLPIWIQWLLIIASGVFLLAGVIIMMQARFNRLLQKRV